MRSRITPGEPRLGRRVRGRARRAVGRRVLRGSLFALLLLAGCGAGDDALRRRAATELRCPSSELVLTKEVEAIGTGERVRVEGCGRAFTYTRMCDGSSGEPIRSCHWTH